MRRKFSSVGLRHLQVPILAVHTVSLFGLAWLAHLGCRPFVPFNASSIEGIGILLAGLCFSCLRPFTRAAGSQLVTVLSTLAIAALFNPLRRRTQTFIDRRFYRQEYNAQRQLSHFATVTRNEVNLKGLSDVMLGVVDETLRPETVGLRLRNSSQNRGGR